MYSGGGGGNNCHESKFLKYDSVSRNDESNVGETPINGNYHVLGSGLGGGAWLFGNSAPHDNGDDYV